MSDPDTIADELAVQQERVAQRLVGLTGELWQAPLPDLAVERLLVQGHFAGHASELDFDPQLVAGHLRDSAAVFRERIERLAEGGEPRLQEFVTDAPERLEGYRQTDPEELVEELGRAQERLVEAVRGLRPEQLDHAGVHEVSGRVTLGEILAYLPDHQRDHADQLAALTGASLA